MSGLQHHAGSAKLRLACSFAFWLLVLCVPVLFLTSALKWAVNEVRLYEYGFNKYKIEQTTGIPNSELRAVAVQLIDYFNSRVDDAQVMADIGGRRAALFKEKELIHLRDVRNLIRLNSLVQLSCLAAMAVCISVLMLTSKQSWLILTEAALAGSGLTMGLMVALAIWCWLGFDQFFYLFHVASFRNEYWMLNPAEDYLIRLFPEGFFYDAALFVFGTVLIVSLLLLIGSLCALRFLGGRVGTQAGFRACQ